MAQILTKVGKVLSYINEKVEPCQVDLEVEQLFRDTDKFVWEKVRECLDEIKYPNLVPDLMYILQCKAHFERATFIRLILEGKGHEWKKYSKILVAEELIYFFQMVLDDVMDESPVRNGKATAHMAFGQGKAISYAEILHAFAHNLLAKEAKRLGLSTNDVIQIWTGFTGMISDICYAQILDLDFEKMPLKNVDEEMYFEFLHNTTPADIANCFKIGGILAGSATNEELEILNRFGLRLGMLMQIRDDLLDFIDDEKLIGKTPFLDVIQNKKRLPIILAYRYSSPEDKNRITTIMGKEVLSTKDKECLHKLLSNDFVISYISKMGENLKEKCLQDLDAIGLKHLQDNLLRQIVYEMADFV